MATDSNEQEMLDNQKPQRKKRRFLKFPQSWKEVRAMGWKSVAIFIIFYLIRDTILYILIPYLIYKGVIGGE